MSGPPSGYGGRPRTPSAGLRTMGDRGVGGCRPRGAGAARRARGWTSGVLLGLLGCAPEAEVSRLPLLADPPVVPPVPETPHAGESRAFELDFGGGGSGAPWGTNLFVPPGAVGSITLGAVPGGKGARVEVPAPGDTVYCSAPVKVKDRFRFEARMRVEAVEGATGPNRGLVVEMRARADDGALVSPAGSRYHPLRAWTAPEDWSTWETEVEVPAAARRAELCWRFVGATGVVEVDRFVVETPGVPTPPPLPIVSVDWPLDRPGGERGAPEGFAFLVPPGTEGASLAHEEGAIRFEVVNPGNALACSEPFAVAPGMVARGRVRVDALSTDPRPWTGFVAELRTWDFLGGLVSPPGQAYTPLHTWKEPVGWVDFEAAMPLPTGATTGKLCFRFVESTGLAQVDEASVGD